MKVYMSILVLGPQKKQIDLSEEVNLNATCSELAQKILKAFEIKAETTPQMPTVEIIDGGRVLKGDSPVPAWSGPDDTLHVIIKSPVEIMLNKKLPVCNDKEFELSLRKFDWKQALEILKEDPSIDVNRSIQSFRGRPSYPILEVAGFDSQYRREGHEDRIELLRFLLNHEKINLHVKCELFGNHVLLGAISSGDQQVIDLVINKIKEKELTYLFTVPNELNPSHQDPTKNTPLLLALKEGLSEVSRELIPYYDISSINQVTARGNSALTLAAYMRMNGVVEALISKGADKAFKNFKEKTASELYETSTQPETFNEATVRLLDDSPYQQFELINFWIGPRDEQGHPLRGVYDLKIADLLKSAP